MSKHFVDFVLFTAQWFSKIIESDIAVATQTTTTSCRSVQFLSTQLVMTISVTHYTVDRAMIELFQSYCIILHESLVSWNDCYQMGYQVLICKVLSSHM